VRACATPRTGRAAAAGGGARNGAGCAVGTARALPLPRAAAAVRCRCRGRPRGPRRACSRRRGTVAGAEAPGAPPGGPPAPAAWAGRPPAPAPPPPPRARFQPRNPGSPGDSTPPSLSYAAAGRPPGGGPDWGAGRGPRRLLRGAGGASAAFVSEARPARAFGFGGGRRGRAGNGAKGDERPERRQVPGRPAPRHNLQGRSTPIAHFPSPLTPSPTPHTPL
jgi:hypothetical protein